MIMILSLCILDLYYLAWVCLFISGRFYLFRICLYKNSSGILGNRKAASVYFMDIFFCNIFCIFAIISGGTFFGTFLAIFFIAWSVRHGFHGVIRTLVFLRGHSCLDDI